MAKLFVKNMVCNRCRYVVQTELERMGYDVASTELGEVELKQKPDKNELVKINQSLLRFGFELIDSQKARLIEMIKTELIRLVNETSDNHKVKISVLLSEKLLKDYSFLSNLFSEVEGQTIEHYFIQLKIEKVKELLMYDEKNLSEIAFQLGYSSVAHLSRQFKQVTGFTPSHFKTIRHKKRIPLEQL
ncbi:MAG: AraC family transcriptional regulator [Chitinophagales bacterium]